MASAMVILGFKETYFMQPQNFGSYFLFLKIPYFREKMVAKNF